MATAGSRSTGALSNDPYDSTTWNGDLAGATKNVLRDQFVVIQAAIDTLESDTATDLGTKVDKTTTIATTSPLQGGGDLSTGRTLSILQAGASQSGYLSSTDWNTFNNKVSTGRSISTTLPLSGGGDLSANRTLTIVKSDASHDGYLSAVDWSDFDSKQDAGDYITGLQGEASASGPGLASVVLANSAVIAKVLTGFATSTDPIIATDAIVAAFGKAQGQINAIAADYASKTVVVTATAPLTGGGDLSANFSIGISQSATAADGYLSATDWNTFNNKQTHSLSNGKIWIGNSGVASEETVSGDVVISASGVTSISAGVIVDADINASAAIARSKLANGTANHVVINNGSGGFSSEAALSPTRGGTGVSNDATQTLTRTGNHSLTIITSGATSVTLPTTGTLSTLAGSETLTGKSIDGNDNTFSNIPNSATTATSSNTNSAIVARDGSGNFAAGVITASQITLGNAPSASTDAATKQYVDDIFAGGATKGECVASSLGNVSGYSAGVITTGATPASQAANFDGVTLVNGDRVLVKAQTDAKQNGIYVASIVSSNLVLTRTSDANTSAELKGANTFVVSGSTLAGTGWVMNAFPFVLDTNDCTWVQNYGSGTYTASGGIVLTANNFAIGTSGSNGISNSMINTGAAIAWSKMAAVAAASIILGSAGNVATVTAVSGDIAIDSSGVVAIASGVIVNADVKSDAAIDLSKLAALTASKVLVSSAGGVIAASSVTTTTLGFLDATSSIQTQIDAKLTKTLASANIFVGNASNVATAAAVTGDILIDNAGVVAIASGVIVDADVSASAALDRTKLASGSNNHVIINNGSGVLSSEAQLAKTRGGTGITSTATFPSSGTVAVVPSSGVVKSNGSVLSSSAVDLASEVTGTLGVGNGGTGLAALGTGNQLLGVNNGASAAEYKTISGTTSRVTVTHGVGTIVLSGPQDLASGSSPTFAGLTLTSFSGVVKATAGVLSAATVVDADIDASAAIARSKIATGTNNHVVINGSGGALSSEAALAKSRGGTGIDNSSVTFPSSGIIALVPSTGVVKSNGSVLSVSNVSLTTEVSGQLPIANGGTNAATQTAAFDNLSPVTTRGDIIVRGASNNVRLALGAARKFLGSDGTDATWLDISVTAAKSADYVITDTDGFGTILYTTSNTDRTLTLPTAADNANRILRIKKVDSGTGKVIIDGEGSETIDDALTLNLYSKYEAVTLQCNGTAWFVLEAFYNTVYEFGQTTMTNLPGASGVYASVQQVDLPIGKWAINFCFNLDGNGASITSLLPAFSTSSGDDVTGTARGKSWITKVVNSSYSSDSLASPEWEQIVTTPTTYYMKIRANFSGGPTAQYVYYLRCRRIP